MCAPCGQLEMDEGDVPASAEDDRQDDSFPAAVLTPRQCSELASSLLAQGASQELVRAIRNLYDDPMSLERRPWLLQPVRRARHQEHEASVSFSCVEGVSAAGSSVFPEQGPPDTPRSAAGARSGYTTPRCHSVASTSARSRPSSSARVGGPPPAPKVHDRPGSAAQTSRQPQKSGSSSRSRASSARPPQPKAGAPYAVQPSMSSLGFKPRRSLSARSCQASVTSMGGTSTRDPERTVRGAEEDSIEEGSRISVAFGATIPGGTEATCSCSADAVCFNCCCRRPTAVPASQRPRRSAGTARPSDAFLQQRRARSASGQRSAATHAPPPNGAASEEAESQAKAEEAKRMKQERIRNWLQRKEAEIAARRRLEEEEAMLQKEQEALEQQRRNQHEADLNHRRQVRLRAAARQRKEFDLEVDHGCYPHSARGPREQRERLRPRSQVVPASTVAAYATPRAGGSLRTPRK
eukprot:TRINITY_DN93684_c0_g1_i1.p1 TRINITY_DN93684_c0_g1~~TRINITY_DN93684_c0_g1_i1.p1  ORF type:complete len:466 (-),score=78.03 TRINITY_DN93684_c0_g1_i1:44-1441(-)